MMSIYYQARRSHPLTQLEQEQITQILEESAESNPFLEMGETLGQYPQDLTDKACIFAGSVKLPFSCEMENADLLEMQTEAMFFFMKWLTKLRRAVPDAEWDVSLEDVPLIWEEEDGWRLMTDEEYHELC